MTTNQLLLPLRTASRTESGARLFVLLVTLLFAVGSSSRVGADTTAETTITVSTQNAGAFTVAFAELPGGYTFLNETNGTTFTVSAIEGDTATVVIGLTWTDDRADGERAPYSIALGADDLSSTVARPDGQGNYSIPSSLLSIVQIGHEPPAQPTSLDTMHTVIESGTDPQAGTSTLQIQLRLDIPASSYPTTYSTTLHLQVTHNQGP
jgi:hypothetical protein